MSVISFKNLNATIRPDWLSKLPIVSFVKHQSNFTKIRFAIKQDRKDSKSLQTLSWLRLRAGLLVQNFPRTSKSELARRLNLTSMMVLNLKTDSSLVSTLNEKKREKRKRWFIDNIYTFTSNYLLFSSWILSCGSPFADLNKTIQHNVDNSRACMTCRQDSCMQCNACTI